MVLCISSKNISSAIHSHLRARQRIYGRIFCCVIAICFQKHEIHRKIEINRCNMNEYIYVHINTKFYVAMNTSYGAKEQVRCPLSTSGSQITTRNAKYNSPDFTVFSPQFLGSSKNSSRPFRDEVVCRNFSEWRGSTFTGFLCSGFCVSLRKD